LAAGRDFLDEARAETLAGARFFAAMPGRSGAQ
jgi:hypothetical protein